MMDITSIKISKVVNCLLLLIIISSLLLTTACQQQSDEELGDPVVTAEPNYTYANLNEHLSELKENYDNLAITTFGKSIYENDLYVLTLGEGDKNVGVVGGIHGRENITSLLTLKLYEDYLREYQEGNSIGEYELEQSLSEVTFYFIPMLNPDGVEIAIDGIDGYENREFFIEANDDQKNFSRWKANGRGVDLNSQFKADWLEVDSEPAPYYQNYKGTSPESEPESRALAELTRENSFEAVISFHHSGEVIYWYYQQPEEQKERDYQLAQKISEINNYDLISPDESDVPAAGYKDWFIKKFNKPGFTIEIGTQVQKEEGPLPADNLNKYFEENREVLLAIAEEV